MSRSHLIRVRQRLEQYRRELEDLISLEAPQENFWQGALHACERALKLLEIELEQV